MKFLELGRRPYDVSFYSLSSEDGGKYKKGHKLPWLHLTGFKKSNAFHKEKWFWEVL